MSATPLPDPRISAVDYDPFAQAPLARVVPSTEAQREIWLAAKLDAAASLAYNESISLRLRGALDADALRHALQALLDRHEALRATFSPDGRELCIAERIELPWQARDLTTLEADARAAEVAATLQRVVETPFDLERGPLVTAELLRLGAEDHLLVLNTHHLICDGWSFGVIARELAALYAAARSGEPARLPGADSFAEFALAEARHPDSEAFRDDERYWLACYAQVPAPLELPLDRPRPRHRTTASRRIDHVLDATLVGDLRRTGARHGASLYATLLAGFAALLQRLTGEDEVVVGIPAAGQAAGGHHALVGHAVNVLPLRVAPDPAAPFAAALARLRGDLLDAFEHQRYTFGTLLKRLALARDPARLPLVSVLFNLDQALDEGTLRFADLRFELAGVPRRFENFELFINAVQVAGAVRLECQYNADLFDAATVTRWLDAYATLLRAAADDPQQTLAALPLLSAAGLAELQALQPPATPFDAGARVEAEFFAQAARTPERPAVRCGEVCWTYAQLAARAEQIAAAVRARGVGTGALVGIALERGPDMVAAVLGVLRAGAGYVPLDPAFPRERLAFMAADAQLALLVTQAALADTIAWPHTLLLDGDNALPAAEPAAAAKAGGDAVAYVIYTSGSTGKPKGVRVPHRAVVNFLASMRRAPGLAADDRLLAVTTLSFDIAVLELLLPLGVGAEVVLATREQAVDGPALAALLASSAATVMQATPATWRLLLEAGWRGGAGFRALCGGEALAPDLAAALLERCGALWNLYGPTETTVWSTCAEITSAAGGIPIGRPIDNTTVWVLDAAQRPCPVGVPGELAIGGAGVTLGYLDRPELTAERFIADPFGAPGARLYRTGDRGRWRNDGTLEHLGRLDFQVKLRGYRIELGEIEARLAERPEVARALALVREDQPGDARLVAYVVPRDGAVLDEALLREHLQRTLPAYMLPQHFVFLAALPSLPNGKVDRKALPPPAAPAARADRPRVAPRNEREQRVAAAMEAVLALPDLDVHDDFFALGGHSLLAAQLTARLSREFGVTLPFRTLFDAPTIEGVAAAIGERLDRGSAAAVQPIARRAEQARAPLSLMQQRLWSLEELQPGRVAYNAPSAHRLRGHLDEAAFERAFAALMARQPILRTAIQRIGDAVEQRVEADLEVRLFPAEDLSAQAEPARTQTLMQRLQELTDTPFDLTRAPLFSARMFRLAADEHVLFFMPHHIIWDGWSFDILYAELAHLYRAFKTGAAPALPPLAVTYGDFAVWHAQWLEGPQFQEQLAFWRARLAQTPPALPLPADSPRRPGMSGQGGTEWITVAKDVTEAMHALARAAGATLNMALLALYLVLLRGFSGQRQLVVGTPVRGRDRVEFEPVMGYFNNLVPLHAALDDTQPFLDFVRDVRTLVVDCFGHPNVPLEYLQRELTARHGNGAGLPYQALFSFQDARQRDVDWGGLHHEQILLFQRGATEDLGLWFLENAHGMIGGIIYNADILQAGTARLLRDRYQDLLARVIADPRQSIADLAAITAAEREQVLAWSHGAAAGDAPASVVDAFERQVERAPDRLALVAGSWSTRYAELEQRANRIAACLRTRGVDRGGVIGLCAEAGIARLAGLLGILKAGGTAVLLDPADPAERIADIVADARIDVLLGDSRLEAALPWPRDRALWFDAHAAEIVAAAATRAATAIAPDAMAVVVYAAGADGRLCGSGLSHRALANTLQGLGQALGLTAADRLAGTSGPASGIGLLECLLPLSIGAAFIQASAREDGAAVAALLQSSRASVMFAAPGLWQAMLAAGWPGDPQLRAVCVNGPPEPELALRLGQACREVWNTFGTTATAFVATCGRIDQPSDSVGSGRPLAGQRVQVLDAQQRLCPVGAVGEIWLGGDSLCTAFGRRAEETARAADGHPPPDASDMRRSRVSGRWLANGEIQELGFLDRHQRLAGEDHEPAEVEARLLAQAGIAQAIAVVRRAAAADPWIDAWLVPGDGATPDLEHLRDRLAATLPAPLLPRHLVALPSLPRLANGEVDVAALPLPADARGGGQDDPADRLNTANERLLAEIWQGLLGIPHVRASDNFFDLGGHSLLAVEMVALVEARTRMRLNLFKLANNSLRALAAELPEGAAAPSGPEAATLGQRLRGLLGFGRRSTHE